MQIRLNGEAREVAATTLAVLLIELDYGAATLATALNGTFVRAADRAGTALRDGDAVEVVTPRQGG